MLAVWAWQAGNRIAILVDQANGSEQRHCVAVNLKLGQGRSD